MTLIPLPFQLIKQVVENTVSYVGALGVKRSRYGLIDHFGYEIRIICEVMVH